MTVEELDRLGELVIAAKPLPMSPHGIASTDDSGKTFTVTNLTAEHGAKDRLYHAAPSLIALAREALAARDLIDISQGVVNETEAWMDVKCPYVDIRTANEGARDE